ncbi:MAG TPA: sigma-54 dependent transcriptional regulator [Planctomycetota bacterium]|nr:sigma-54 dependent transcriptional regulator [Planctomycetota bacterium]
MAAHPCLVVAKSEATRILASSAARSAGLIPLTAVDVATALAAFERSSPIAGITSEDLGAESVAELRARAASCEPAVSIITIGAASIGDAAAGEEPFDRTSLVRRLRRILRESGPTSNGPAATTDLSSLGLVGRSPALGRLCDRIARVSRFRANVLVLGESGTGKEVVARALHACGPQAQHLFVPLNCAAVARDIVENELFGHEKGAFTGANERKRGLFELADRGTLFLDEIGEMELSTQAKLLRVLERNEFRRVGGSGKIKVDVNVVAASNRNLATAIAEGRFRKDLYYRLKVVTLVVPPLRERKEDIPLLVEHFISDFNRRHGAEVRIAPRALRRLTEHDWPGNIRELKNAVESCAIFATKETIQLPDVIEVLDAVPMDAAPAPGVPGTESPALSTLADAERRLVLEAVRRSTTKAEAARALGIGLRTLYTKLNEYQHFGASPAS